MTFVGWLGSFLLAVCGLPQAIESYRTKSSKGITWSFLLMWLFGEILTLTFLIPKTGVLPLLFNYSANILFISVIIYYKIGEKVDPK